MIIRFRDRIAVPREFKVGVEMDNGVGTVEFQLPEIADGQIETLYWQNGEHADAELLTNHVWTLANTMTQYPGEAVCYITISDGDELLWHSEAFVCQVAALPDIEGTVDQTYPSAIQAGVEAAAASAAEAAAIAAAMGISVSGTGLVITTEVEDDD